MPWQGAVYREAGNYGAVGGFVPLKDLGTHTFASQPERGQIVKAQGEEWIVVHQYFGYIEVKPRMMKTFGKGSARLTLSPFLLALDFFLRNEEEPFGQVLEAVAFGV